jgi:hypothetical protein
MSVNIPLTRGFVAIVDDEDAERMASRKWSVKFGKRTQYAQTNANTVPNTTLRMHRLIMDAALGQHVDHIDGNGLNNTRANLRFCTNAENSMNRRKRLGVTSQYKGVSWYSKKEIWGADIWIDGRTKNLGTYVLETDAARAYDAAARWLFGEFAQLNFPDQNNAHA